MALFKVDSARAAYPQCMVLQGSFVVPAAPAYNQQIIPTNLALTQPGTSGAQVSNAVNPTGIKVNVFASPFVGQPLPATNTSRPPPGQAVGAVSQGSEFLLDLTGFPADIVSAEVDICRQQRNGVVNDVQCSLIDTVNKLIYIQVVLFTSGAATTPPAGSVISFMVTFKDSIGI